MSTQLPLVITSAAKCILARKYCPWLGSLIPHTTLSSEGEINVWRMALTISPTTPKSGVAGSFKKEVWGFFSLSFK